MTTDGTAIRVVGTAGHVDHGKSTLLTALTGMDPDRLREERERGMTIDLGFAWVRLPSGDDVGFVDVPGHQDFIRNMLAGIGSIDAVLLVIAADEGVMPQTREHLAILGLLGIDRGVVALTKRDLVDDEWAALAIADVRAALRETPLADAPLVEVSATARTGLEDLMATLGQVLGAAPARRDVGRPRLPVDRSFTMSGFGTVVTGTLLDGSLSVGDEVEAVPGALRGRIRGLQTHRRSLDIARPGSRVAVNVSGIDKEAVARGMVLARPGTLRTTDLLAVRLAMLPSASAPLAHDEELKVHVGTAETMARAALLEGPLIAPGESAWAQLRLAAPVAAAVGDRLVVRRPSPSETIGGGAIADVTTARLRRRAETVAGLERRTAPSEASRLLASLDVPRTAAEAAERSGLTPGERDVAVAELVADGRAVALGDAILSRGAFEGLATHVERLCAQAHRTTPLRAGASREQARSALGLPPKRFAALVERLVSERRLVERGSALALPSHRPALSDDQERRWLAARAALAKDPLQPPSPAQLEVDHGVDREMVAALAERGDVVRIGTEAVFLPDAVARFARAIVDELTNAGSITVARARDLTGSSRKHVLPLLQFLDDRGLTRRHGDDRILVLSPDQARERITSLSHRGEDHP
ncbi:MAG TPA: selenocysteine-specific translation elongation factor [Candidatus Limnocylindria bacterium]|nr:selenocysteine-specific translation elongation factor [Candidatus Limnocylindria bacterium]